MEATRRARDPWIIIYDRSHESQDLKQKRYLISISALSGGTEGQEAHSSQQIGTRQELSETLQRLFKDFLQMGIFLSPLTHTHIHTHIKSDGFNNLGSPQTLQTDYKDEL